MKTKFDSVKQLPNQQLIAGMKLCVENSNDLYNGALALQQKKLYGAATSILILSVEELVKAFGLFNLLITDGDIKDGMKQLFEHKELHKNRHEYAMFMTQYLKHARAKGIKKNNFEYDSPKELSEILLKKINFPLIFKNMDKNMASFNNWFAHANTLKNAGLYVAYSNKWHSPNNITENDFLRSIKETNTIRKDINFIMKFIFELKDIDAMVSFLKQVAVEYLNASGFVHVFQ